MNKNRGEEKDLKTYLDMLSFLSGSSDDYFFCLDYESGKIYFFGDLIKKFDVFHQSQEYTTLVEWQNVVYPRDIEELADDLDKVQKGKRSIHNLTYRMRDRQGNYCWINCRGKPVLDQNNKPIFLVGRVTESPAVTQSDGLTGAMDVTKLTEEINEILVTGIEGYLLLVGIDNLKEINLKKGRNFGDQVLQKTSVVFEDNSHTHHIFRINGNRFAALLPGVSKETVKEIFHKTKSGLSTYCSISGGCVPFRKYHVLDASTFIQYGETCLDLAQGQNLKELKFFTAEDYEKELDKLRLKEELAIAIENNFQGFQVVYQPQINSVDYTVWGAEALLRYNSPDKGTIPVFDVITILEQSGLIKKVGLWVLDKALEQCAKWRKVLPNFHISVNISYGQFEDDDIVDKILDSMSLHKVSGTALTLEVTESMELHTYGKLNKVIEELQYVGIEFSVDDFGTGFSSLSRLKQLNVDEIKIDRCFVSGIQKSVYNYRLLNNMIEWANKCDIRVCCEGVEQEEELSVLETLYPQILQGFLFDKPISSKDFTEIYIDATCDRYKKNIIKCSELKKKVMKNSDANELAWSDIEKLKTILEAQHDIISVSDINTYELYYLNSVGLNLVDKVDYKGRRCYEVLYNRTEPCEFCTNNLISENDFYTWFHHDARMKEKCIYQDRIIPWENKKVRLEVVSKISKYESIKQVIDEKLDFADNIISCSRLLSSTMFVDDIVPNTLALIGSFYKADRAFMFEPQEDGKFWSNTYEWNSINSPSHRDYFQKVPVEKIKNWLKVLSTDTSIVILNSQNMADTYPEEFQLLKSQNISRLILVPIVDNCTLSYFIGVDNHRHCLQDDSQIRVLSAILSSRLMQEKREKRLKELLDFKYGKILDLTNVGLWIVHINRKTGEKTALADDTLKRILGIHEALSPKETFDFWYERIESNSKPKFADVFQNLDLADAIVQVDYVWNHPIHGKVIFSCSGTQKEISENKVCLVGYMRNLSKLDRSFCIM